jgi:hypothetical protein
MDLVLMRARQLLLASQLLAAGYLMIIAGLLVLGGSASEVVAPGFAVAALIALYVLERTARISTAESVWYSLATAALSIGSLLPLLAISGTWLGHAIHGWRIADAGWALDPEGIWRAWNAATSAWFASDQTAGTSGVAPLLVLAIGGLAAPERGRAGTSIRIVLLALAVGVGIAAGAGWDVPSGWSNRP